MTLLKSMENLHHLTSLTTAERYLTATFCLSMASDIMNLTAIRFAAKWAAWLTHEPLQLLIRLWRMLYDSHKDIKIFLA